MKYKLCIIFFIIFSCTSNYTRLDVKDPYNAKGFAHIFNETDYENKIIKGKLDLTLKEYKQLIKDIKKALKYKEYEVDRPSYAVIKYSFIRDSVWVYYNKKAFSAVKLDLDYLNSKL